MLQSLQKIFTPWLPGKQKLQNSPLSAGSLKKRGPMLCKQEPFSEKTPALRHESGEFFCGLLYKIT